MGKQAKNGKGKQSFHYKIIASILLLVLASQVAFYLFLNHYMASCQQEVSKLLQGIPKFSTEVDPLSHFHQVSNLDLLAPMADAINKRIQDVQGQRAFQEQYASTRQELQQISLRVSALKEEMSRLAIGEQQQVFRQYLDEQSLQYRFIFPKTVWVFEELKEGYFQKMNQVYIDNIKRVSLENGYSLNFVNYYNYPKFTRRDRMVMVTETLEILRARIDNRTDPLLTEEVYSEIKRTLIMLLVLEQNGGVMISKYFAMVQSLEWLRKIAVNRFINRGGEGLVPRVFGFYNISRSSARMLLNRTSDNRFKFLVKYPGIIPYFLVAVRGSGFVRDVLNSVCSLLQSPAKYLSSSEKLKMDKKSQFLYFISHNKIYDEFFEIATMNVLLGKEGELQREGQGTSGLDHYGVVTMNANYGPEKVTFFFQNSQGRKILKHLAQLHLSEFEAEIGKLRYIHRLPSYYELNDYVNNLTAYQDTLVRDSYFHRFLYPTSKQKFIIDRVEVAREDEEAQPWTSLPRKIWIYWHDGLEKSNIIYQLCADNLERYGRASGFQVNIVSDSNLNEYLSTETIQKIEYAVTHQASIVKSKYIKYDLIRLALVAEHGGIYMDLSYILLEGLEWLVNIGRYPSNYIFNRYGSLPRVFMFFHPHYGSPFNWSVNPQVNSKTAWLLGYENNFIAAEQRNELVVQWFEELVKAIQTPYEEIEQEYIRCGVYSQRWTAFNDIYLLSMDTVKYVIGRRQTELQASKDGQYWDASDYYRLWSMNGYLGQQKFRSHTSYDTNNHDNLFLRLFSEEDAQEMVGRTFHLTKLYNYPVKFLYSNFMANYHHLHQQFHEDSIFMRYVFNSTRHSMQVQGKNSEKLIIKQ